MSLEYDHSALVMCSHIMRVNNSSLIYLPQKGIETIFFSNHKGYDSHPNQHVWIECHFWGVSNGSSFSQSHDKISVTIVNLLTQNIKKLDFNFSFRKVCFVPVNCSCNMDTKIIFPIKTVCNVRIHKRMLIITICNNVLIYSSLINDNYVLNYLITKKLQSLLVRQCLPFEDADETKVS